MSAERAADPHDRSEPARRFLPDAGEDTPAEHVLRRPVSLALAGRITLVLLLTMLAGVLLRLVRLDAYVLGDKEAEWAYDAWSLFHGRPLPGLDQIPDTAPLFLIVEALSFFLFGVSDAIARFGPALFGAGILGLVLCLRPFVSRFTLIGMGLLAAFSPTLVYASRTIDPAIAVAFTSLLLVVALLRAPLAGRSGSGGGWITLAGFGAAGMIASGPEGITAIIAVSAGLFAASVMDGRDVGAARSSMKYLGGSINNVSVFGGSFILSLLILFTRLFSDIGALGGILTTFADWGRMMAARSTALPQSFFLYAVLLYEIFAVAFAIVLAVSSPNEETRHGRRLSPALFGVWFVVSMLFHSFASGRVAEQAVLVAMPLVLMGGMGLGRILERINWAGFWTTRAGLLPLALVGLFIGAIAIVMVIARSNDPGGARQTSWSPLFQIIFVIVVVVLPMAYLIWSHTRDRMGIRELSNSALLVLALLLALFTLRSTTALAFYRADDGTELLARNVPTEGVKTFVNQVSRLSRDLSVEKLTKIDNTGSYGVSIAISPDVEWPFAWYFRDYPKMRVAGPAGWTADDDIVIATAAEGMDTAGFVVQLRAFENRTANAHFDLNGGTILGNIFSVEEWYPSFRYLLFREMDSHQAPSNIYVGYAFRVIDKINPSLGPFDLFLRNTPGPGSGLGQLSSPTDIAMSPDGQTLYVVNAGNQRIERYDRNGTFVGIWDATKDPGLSLAFTNGQGASGITVGDDGLIYVADTWNHIVLVLDQEGHVVRQLGQRGVLTDIGDGGDPESQPGLFFGPRGIAVVGEEIYVTDTGNERIQVFGKDGTFLRAFGGFGTGDGQLQEPTGIVDGPEGNLYVADSGNARVVVFSPQGDVISEIPVESWTDQLGVDRVNYLAFGGDGVLYLTSPARGTLEAWDGTQIVPIDGADLARPAGLIMAPDGMLLVTDVAESEVLQFAPVFPAGFGETASPVASPGSSPEASPVG